MIEPSEHRLPEYSGEIRREPGLLLAVRPLEEAYETARRAVQASIREKTGKDFIDLLCILGVLSHVRPAMEEMLEEDDSWKSGLPAGITGVKTAVETHASGKTGQYYIIIYILDPKNRTDPDKWKGLMATIVRKFF
ncbi:MAG: hypothetical protein JXQ83_02215 [Candidatus Glassbacteria bacterium]|nr:hypothetical protein [Candidatus Glassbacteria bacterium]